MRRIGLFVPSLAAVVFGAAVATAKPSGTGVTISAAPNPVVYGSTVMIKGQVTGKNNGSATATLYAKLAPSYSTPKAVATTTTSASGQYKFKTAPAQNATYFVKVHTAPESTSSTVLVKVRAKVTLTLTGGAGHMFFTGFVLPDYAGKSVVIQRRTAHGWKKVASPTLTGASSVSTALGTTTRSKYRKRLRLKSGTYRVFFDPADGLRISNHSRKHKI
jgi:hypothetical protein